MQSNAIPYVCPECGSLLTAVNGSPRKGNTVTAIHAFAEGLTELRSEGERI